MPREPYGQPGTRRAGLTLRWAARDRLMGGPDPARDRVRSGSGRVLRVGFSSLNRTFVRFPPSRNPYTTSCIYFPLASLVRGSRGHVTLVMLSSHPIFYSRYIKRVANHNIHFPMII